MSIRAGTLRWSSEAAAFVDGEPFSAFSNHSYVAVVDFGDKEVTVALKFPASLDPFSKHASRVLEAAEDAYLSGGPYEIVLTEESA